MTGRQRYLRTRAAGRSDGWLAEQPAMQRTPQTGGLIGRCDFLISTRSGGLGFMLSLQSLSENEAHGHGNGTQ